jgi:hypothetical protein
MSQTEKPKDDKPKVDKAALDQSIKDKKKAMATNQTVKK